MSKDYVLNACVCQHVRGNLACVSALLLEVHVLSANLDVGALGSLYYRDDVDSLSLIHISKSASR